MHCEIFSLNHNSDGHYSDGHYSDLSMILLFYSLFSDFTGLVKNMAIDTAQAQWDADPDESDRYTCQDGQYGVNDNANVLIVCWDSYSQHPVTYVGLIIISLSAFYGFCVLMYAYFNSPQYGSIEYYAYMVMTK